MYYFQCGFIHDWNILCRSLGFFIMVLAFPISMAALKVCDCSSIFPVSGHDLLVLSRTVEDDKFSDLPFKSVGMFLPFLPVRGH